MKCFLFETYVLWLFFLQRELSEREKRKLFLCFFLHERWRERERDSMFLYWYYVLLLFFFFLKSLPYVENGVGDF